jgi:uncharacterized protein YcfJ
MMSKTTKETMTMNKTMTTTLCVVALAMTTGCSNLSGQTNGAMIGGGVGALAGQAIGHDTESTLIGGGIGALAGSIFGNEAEHQARRQRERDASYRHDDGSYTRRESTTSRTLNPDGTYTTSGSETTTSQEETNGYTGLPQ